MDLPLGRTYTHTLYLYISGTLIVCLYFIYIRHVLNFFMNLQDKLTEEQIEGECDVFDNTSWLRRGGYSKIYCNISKHFGSSRSEYFEMFKSQSGRGIMMMNVWWLWWQCWLWSGDIVDNGTVMTRYRINAWWILVMIVLMMDDGGAHWCWRLW